MASERPPVDQNLEISRTFTLAIACNPQTMVPSSGGRVRPWQRFRAELPMPKPPMTERVEILEQRVEMLESLPARLAEIKSLCEAIRADTETFRQEIRAENEIFRQEIRAENAIFRAEIRSEHGALRTELVAAIRASEEETRRQMRMLHEEVISRIARIEKG